MYWSTCLNITHYQSRHHNPVENPSLWHHLFLKVHHSIQIFTPTYPSICLLPHILWVQHHEKSFLLYYHSYLQDHISFCPRCFSCLLESPYGLLLVPIAKELVQLAKNLQSCASSQHLCLLALISYTPRSLPLKVESWDLWLKSKLCGLNLGSFALIHLIWWGEFRSSVEEGLEKSLLTMTQEAIYKVFIPTFNNLIPTLLQVIILKCQLWFLVSSTNKVSCYWIRDLSSNPIYT